MKKIFVSKIIIIVFAIILFIALLSIFSACTPLEPAFEDIVISSKVDMGSNKPLDKKTDFEDSAENIYATISYSNARGDDSYRFKWINLDTEIVVRDVEDQYAKDMKGKYVSGIVMTKISSEDFSLKMMPPGKYNVDFYHNGEVVKTATFKVTQYHTLSIQF